MKNLISSAIIGTALLKKGKIKMATKFKFTKQSSVVKAWVALVLSEEYTLEDVPALFNLREVVAEVSTSQQN